MKISKKTTTATPSSSDYRNASFVGSNRVVFNIKGVPDAKLGVKKILRCEMHAENVYFQQKKRISNNLRRHFY